MTTTTATATTAQQCAHCGWATTAHTAGELARCNYEARTIAASLARLRGFSG